MKYIKIFEEFILEDGGMTSAMGGPLVSGGMGDVVNSQPASIPGTTFGGTVGSGDISIPYNASGGERVFHQISTPSINTIKNKKTKKKKNIKDIKDKISKAKEETPKVMNYQDFIKFDINQIKK
ncbi:MAG: hypothetical protein M0R46_10455 [Candidatus Muirbacterium halophilum]|nr:hypothetical protein [Candidatus Muirbacterium halophilum]